MGLCGWHDEGCQVQECLKRPGCSINSRSFVCQCGATGYQVSEAVPSGARAVAPPDAYKQQRQVNLQTSAINLHCPNGLCQPTRSCVTYDTSTLVQGCNARLNPHNLGLWVFTSRALFAGGAVRAGRGRVRCAGVVSERRPVPQHDRVLPLRLHRDRWAPPRPPPTQGRTGGARV